MTMRLSFVASLVAAMVVMLAPGRVCAQADSGRVEPLRLIGVFDAKTGDWINRVTVRDTLGIETQTTRYGIATLNVLTAIAGFYLLEIRKEGYVPRRIRLRADTSYEIMFALEPNPLGNATYLPAVVTTERQLLQNDAGERRGFFARCQIKTVQCIGRAELDRRSTGYLDNIVSMQPGIHRDCGAASHGAVFNPAPKPVYDDQLFGCLIQMRSSFGGYCTPTYLVDGFEWQPLGGRVQVLIDQSLPPKHIEGIEIYAPNAPRPPRFSGPIFDGGCGMIVIWTR